MGSAAVAEPAKEIKMNSINEEAEEGVKINEREGLAVMPASKSRQLAWLRDDERRCWKLACESQGTPAFAGAERAWREAMGRVDAKRRAILADQQMSDEL